ncbi:vesicle-associated membrane protein 7-like [Dreissena polymorpha]|uniref:Vesicle-associated membrane protein 7 n=1 Tax=Dreissena polymorpha TaxID=45954 RepID=A0A9D4RB70_DREPO|nr:vesicle-associated membrane protein 7-like [Dreissena polymorpha]XP_052262429.1 vesicle-associated membrane protein 7-like [Dreissena polymorpha]XP_052262430.1 vesicle-associated membrane protein 7-like [Dreissena polymorpha]KAH3861794.1 hypothetical protein DPMN_024745 [Dreissena polymorpha]
MAILYSCIARGTTVLCSHGLQAGANNYEAEAVKVLPQIPVRNDGKTTITMASFKFHCIVENGVIFMCAAKPDFKTQPCFAFLTEIKDEFHSRELSDKAAFASNHSFDAEFNSTLNKQMEKFSKPGAADNLTVLQGQVKEVQGVMAKNIESVIERGERLDDLMDKTDDLEAASATFARTAGKIKKKYWWRNLKMKIIIGIVVTIVLLIIVLGICYGTGVFKGSSDDKKTTVAPSISTIATPPSG